MFAFVFDLKGIKTLLFLIPELFDIPLNFSPLAGASLPLPSGPGSVPCGNSCHLVWIPALSQSGLPNLLLIQAKLTDASDWDLATPPGASPRPF